MKIEAISFSADGAQIIQRINADLARFGMDPVSATDGKTQPVTAWAASVFQPGNALLFVGACGIAVRALSGLPQDKLQDCPVIVIDDMGQFVIPLLSGHAGSAGKLAVILADILDAVPVITTATDIHETFSADTYAIENRLTIKNKDGIKKVSVKALEEKKVTLSIKDYPPKDPVDVIVADETDAAYSLLLAPKPYTVGLGMKKNKDRASVEAFVTETLQENGIAWQDVYAVCTIDAKEDEPAIKALRDRHRIPVLSFDAALLQKAEGTFTSSAFVQDTVGVDNVCERAAVLGAGAGAELILQKTSRDGMTIAIAKRCGMSRSLM